MLFFVLFAIVVIIICGYMIKECHDSYIPADRRVTVISAFIILILVIILKVMFTHG